MAKKRSFRGKPKKNKMPSKGNMMAQIQQMQAQMEAQQAEMETKEFTATAGGGALSVTVTGHQRIKDIAIDPELIDPDDVEMLTDLLIATINQAIEQSQAKAAEAMEGLTGGMGINDLLGGMGMGGL